MVAQSEILGAQAVVELLATGGDLTSATNGQSIKLMGAFSDVKFTIKTTGTVSLIAEIQHSPNDSDWATLAEFNNGALITTEALHVLTPASGGATLSWVRLNISTFNTGQIDAGDATVVQHVKNTGS